MSHQKALLIPSKSAPFELGTRLIPTPGPGQVLVKNVAVALNPVDHYVQAAGVFVEEFGFPALAGVDAAGEIEAVGEGVHGWKKGDRVYVCLFTMVLEIHDRLFSCVGRLYKGIWPPDRATFQEYTIADALTIARVRYYSVIMEAKKILQCWLDTSRFRCPFRLSKHQPFRSVSALRQSVCMAIDTTPGAQA